ncbi:allantoate amidohydrolase [Catenulispora subtropica]|uniref:Allantoate amidohydrolase n=2 Tax=Catenulispora subtropica TaxID=450798 RepID=A0ABN2QFN5_9ACTN
MSLLESIHRAVDEAEASGYTEMWRSLLPLGLDSDTGGYRRFAWNAADLACREWFRAEAAARGLDVETDRNGNLWAWWGPKGPGAVVTGSHLDSVPDGGAYDGPLGVVSSFAAIDVLRARGFTPGKPFAVACFSDEEGARFGIACAGSRLLTGALDPDKARGLRDLDGVTMADAMERAGRDPGTLGRDDERLEGIAAYVELHVEQGKALAFTESPVAVASAIWPHSRWRFDFSGEANHAGTTRLEDRRDPMLTYANTVLAARKKAKLGGAVATFGRLVVEPNGTNAIPSRVRAWLDVRAPADEILAAVTEEIIKAADERAGRDGTAVAAERESHTPIVEFDDVLRNLLAGRLRQSFGAVPVLPTGAGHDAGILAAAVPTAMLYVRNPSGVSHAPGEHAEHRDCLAGVTALADVLQELAQ